MYRTAETIYALRYSAWLGLLLYWILPCKNKPELELERPTFLPMRQLHFCSTEWLQRLALIAGWWASEEFDVADCFLSTARAEVLFYVPS